jgi:hypothetical protein
MFRKLTQPLRQLTPVVLPLAALLVTMVSVLIPNGNAQACLPCTCTENHALNCYGGFHVNTVVDPKTGDCAIEVLGIDGGGNGYQAIYASAKALAKLPEFPEENTLIEQYYEYSLYKLQNGQYYVGVGPMAENKVYVVTWTGCPASDVKETNYVAGQP